MRSLEKKPKAFQGRTAARPVAHGRVHSGLDRKAGDILHLQRAVGNQVVQRLLGAAGDLREAESHPPASPHFSDDLSRIPVPAITGRYIQPKLKGSVPGDPYEQEADRVGDQVVGAPETAAGSDDHPSLLRSTAGGEGDPAARVGPR